MKPPKLPQQAPKANPIYVYGSLFLFLINALLTYQSGLAKGVVGAQLIGYTLGFMIIPLVVIGISLIREKNRNLKSIIRLAFFSLLFCLVFSLDNYLSTKPPAP